MSIKEKKLLLTMVVLYPDHIICLRHVGARF
jgi:hypothetical protein